MTHALDSSVFNQDSITSVYGRIWDRYGKFRLLTIQNTWSLNRNCGIWYSKSEQLQTVQKSWQPSQHVFIPPAWRSLVLFLGVGCTENFDCRWCKMNKKYVSNSHCISMLSGLFTAITAASTCVINTKSSIHSAAYISHVQRWSYVWINNSGTLIHINRALYFPYWSPYLSLHIDMHYTYCKCTTLHGARDWMIYMYFTVGLENDC